MLIWLFSSINKIIREEVERVLTNLFTFVFDDTDLFFSLASNFNLLQKETANQFSQGHKFKLTVLGTFLIQIS